MNKRFFIRAFRLILTITLSAGLLTGLWFISDFAYSSYIKPSTVESRSINPGVLLGLNQMLEDQLSTRTAEAEAEIGRLSSIIAAGGLSAIRESELQAQLDALNSSREELSRELELARETTDQLQQQPDENEEPDNELRTRNLELELEQTRLRSLIQSINEEILSALADIDPVLAQDFSLAVTENRMPGFIASQFLDYWDQINNLDAELGNTTRDLIRREQDLSRSQEQVSTISASIDELNTTMGNLRTENEELNTEARELTIRLGELLAQNESRSIQLQGLFQASQVNGFFYQEDDILRIALNPLRQREVVEQGTLDVFATGNSAIPYTRILVSEENGQVSYLRYPGQPEPEVGQWF